MIVHRQFIFSFLFCSFAAVGCNQGSPINTGEPVFSAADAKSTKHHTAVRSCSDIVLTKPGSKLVLVVANDETYDALPNELHRFAADIQNTTEYNVALISGNWENGEQLRNLLISCANTHPLLNGAILTGKLPYSFMVVRNAAGEFDDMFTSDYYYQHLKSAPWTFTLSAMAYPIIQMTIAELYNNFKRDIWTSRLYPPSNDATTNIALLKRYFDRHHDYKTGKLVYQKKMAYVENTEKGHQAPNFEAHLAEIKNDIVANSGMYQNTTDIVSPFDRDHATRKQLTIDAWAQNYELGFISVHGDKTYLWFGEDEFGNDVNFTNAEAVNNPSQWLYTHFSSCNTADLRVADYFAGWYLFSGQSLLVKAFTNPFMPNNSTFGVTSSYVVLSSGNDVATIYLNDNNINEQQESYKSLLLGDPTLTFRPKDLHNAPQIGASDIHIDLGTVRLSSYKKGDIAYQTTLRNDGNTQLLLNFHSGRSVWLTSPDAGGETFRLAFNGAPTFTHAQIAPRSGATLTLSVNNPNTRLTGAYQQKWSYYTNDPRHPVIHITATLTNEVQTAPAQQ